VGLLIFANNAETALAQGLTPTTTTIVVAPATGALFPQPTAGTEFYATLTDVATETINEIVLVTARLGDTFTVTRGVDNTTAKSWVAGDIFAMLPTAGTMERFLQKEENLGLTITNDNGTPSNVYPVLAQQTSGKTNDLFVSSPNYVYNPATAQLQARTFYASGGFFFNAKTIPVSTIVPSGQSAMSVGAITQPAGVVVSVAVGSRWVIL
jgi:hypothetical protein